MRTHLLVLAMVMLVASGCGNTSLQIMGMERDSKTGEWREVGPPVVQEPVLNLNNEEEPLPLLIPPTHPLLRPPKPKPAKQP